MESCLKFFSCCPKEKLRQGTKESRAEPIRKAGPSFTDVVKNIFQNHKGKIFIGVCLITAGLLVAFPPAGVVAAFIGSLAIATIAKTAIGAAVTGIGGAVLIGTYFASQNQLNKFGPGSLNGSDDAADSSDVQSLHSGEESRPTASTNTYVTLNSTDNEAGSTTRTDKPFGA